MSAPTKELSLCLNNHVAYGGTQVLALLNPFSNSPMDALSGVHACLRASTEEPSCARAAKPLQNT